MKVKFDNMQQNSKCRLCRERYETVNYIISKCSKLTQRATKLDMTGWEKWSSRNCASD